jgi:ATP-binding cassette, subfamily C, bacterial CydD
MRAADPRLLRHARAARTCLILAVLLGLAVTGLIVAQAALLARALAAAALGTGSRALAGTLLLLLGVVAARAVAAYGGEAAALRAAARVKSQLRRKLIGHCLRLAPAAADGPRPGQVAAQATRGLDGLDPYFARYLPQLVLSVLVPAAMVATVIATDWVSGVVIAVTLPLIPLFAALVGLHTKAATRRQWRLLAQLGGHFLDVVQGLPTLKAFGRAKFQEGVIATVTSEHRSAAMATLRIAFLSALVLELSAALATALVAVETGLRLLYGHLPYQAALLVLLLTPEAYLPLRAVAAQYHASAEGTAAAETIFAILDTPLPARAVRGTAVTGTAVTGTAPPGAAAPVPDLRSATISLAGVTVAYPGSDRPALDGLNLDIGPGELIALIGASGTGKSTALRLLLRFVDAGSGIARAGGTDLAAIPAGPWRAQIAWVPQHPRLFQGSVADNISLGQPRASRAAIMDAARLAGAAAFVEALPHGYDTPLDEQAARLSAGERQQLALARAFLRDAPLLLLDEPTAHLAPDAAAAIDDAIRGPLAGHTIIVATHRVPGLAGASQVITVGGDRRAEPASRPASPLAGAVIR